MKKIIYAIIFILIVIQFIPVDRDNPPVTEEITAPPIVLSILKTSCYDCHSNETNWPWYSYIAPVSFLVAGDVKDGRKNLNFSEWDKYSTDKQIKLFEEMIEEVEKEDMPLPIYTYTHPNAKLDDHKIKLIKDWVKPGSSMQESLRYEKD
ncbi:MAG TPA: heme-binding domain-containing protein [Ignavibacteriaceae bacterium]|nr:heme-binding domain-containing protein [Ignavibacteriaceae bacterium]